MQLEEFEHYILEHVLDGWREDLSVEIKEIPKNNGTLMHGLYLVGDNGNIVPVFYFDEMYEAYQRGVSVQQIIAGIQYEYERSPGRFSEEELEIENFEKVHDRIIFQLTGYEKNRQMLSEVPHLRFLDMAILFRLSFRSQEPERMSSYQIRNRDTELWGIQADQLYALALVNTPELAPARILGMKETIQQGLKTEVDDETCGMTILTNHHLIHGAGVILYPGFLKSYADKIGSNLYLIPSSIHEMICLPENEVDDTDELIHVICDVNQSILDEADILTDSLYFYDRAEDRIHIVKKNS